MVTTETWTVVRRRQEWDKATRKWSYAEAVLATGLTKYEADAMLTRRAHQHDLSAYPERSTNG